MKNLVTILSIGIVVIPVQTRAVVQDTIQISEWEVPFAQSRPRDPYVAPDGRVWFVGQQAHYAAVLNPENGEFTRYDLDEGTGPHNLVVDDEGSVWYTGNLQGHIGRLDPETGEIEKFMMPDERARDPHTMVFNSEGDMWFTVQGGNFIGKFEIATGEIQLVRAPELANGRRGNSSRPYGIKVDSNDRPWIALLGTNMIAAVDPSTMDLSTYELPEGARPRRLEIASDDTIWYVDFSRGYLGHLDPSTGHVEEWENPSGSQSRPYGMAIDKDDRVWFVETGVQPNRFVGFDTVAKTYFSDTPVGSGGGSIRHMFYDPEENVVWFGTDANTVGRAVMPPVRRGVS